MAAASATLFRVGPGTLWPVTSTPEAIATLDAPAATAENSQPAAQLTEGQLIHYKSDGWAGVSVTNPRGNCP